MGVDDVVTFHLSVVVLIEVFLVFIYESDHVLKLSIRKELDVLMSLFIGFIWCLSFIKGT